MNVTTFYVEVNRHDDTVAGTLGDVEWIDFTTCLVLTDDLDGLVERLDSDDNVLNYEEVMEGDNRPPHPRAAVGRTPKP